MEKKNYNQSRNYNALYLSGTRSSNGLNNFDVPIEKRLGCNLLKNKIKGVFECVYIL